MIPHTDACRDRWSMEIQICTCGAERANRELRAKDEEIKRLKRELDEKTNAP